MRKIYHVSTLFLFILTLSVILINPNNSLNADDVMQFRGNERNGTYVETGLLNKWPENGPALLKQITGIGDGYSSPAISNGIIYISGVEGKDEYLFAVDHNNVKLWKTKYGRAARSYTGARSTPTITEKYIYLSSGAGEVVCFNKTDGTIKWSIDATKKFHANYGRWEVAESILFFDMKVIFTPCGSDAGMVALNSETGEIIWKTEKIDGSAGYASPILIEIGGKKIIVTLTEKYMIGVNSEDGKLLWKSDFNIHSTSAVYKGITAPSPIYHDGRLFFTSGYDQVAVMLQLSNDGTSASVAWTSEVLDNHHGNVVFVDGYIYGSNWINNQKGNWICLDWATGKVMYDREWYTKGSIIYNDGMLYCYEEKSGHVALVKATPEKFDVVSSFQIKDGDGPYWAHPVISNKKLYIRHGDILNIYDIKA